MKRQESRHKKQKRAARKRAKPREQRKPVRVNVRQDDFRVVARGVRQEGPDIDRIARTTLDAYLRGELTKS